MPARIHIDAAELEREWQAGAKATDLAKKYGCTVSQIYRVRQRRNLKVKMKNSSREPPAPTPLDERVSRDSLMPSPWVLARIAEIRKIT